MYPFGRMVYLGGSYDYAYSYHCFYEVWDSGFAAAQSNDPQGCLIGMFLASPMFGISRFPVYQISILYSKFPDFQNESANLEI